MRHVISIAPLLGMAAIAASTVVVPAGETIAHRILGAFCTNDAANKTIGCGSNCGVANRQGVTESAEFLTSAADLDTSNPCGWTPGGPCEKNYVHGDRDCPVSAPPPGG